MLYVLRLDDLSADPLAAQEFVHREGLAALRTALAGGRHSVLVLPNGTDADRDWRRALARDLARAYAPIRINIIAGGDPIAIDAAIAYLDTAEGVTGQYLPLSGK